MDVAKEAGVSQSVVSRAFTVGGKVAPETRARVLGVAARLGYQPNAMARGLVTQRSNLVGVVVGDSANPFYPEVLTRFSERLQALGKQVLLLNADTGTDTTQALVLALQYRVEAVIVTTATLSSTVAAAFAGSGVPVVLFNRYTGQPGVRAVSCDNVRGGRDRRGRVAAGGGATFCVYRRQTRHLDPSGSAGGLYDAAWRAVGISARAVGRKRVYLRVGLPRRAELCSARGSVGVPPSTPSSAPTTSSRWARWTRCRGSGLRVPEDVSVVGFDDIPAASWSGYALTTVAQPVEAMIDATVELLGRYSPDAGGNGEGEIKLLPGTLIERATTRARVLEVG